VNLILNLSSIKLIRSRGVSQGPCIQQKDVLQQGKVKNFDLGCCELQGLVQNTTIQAQYVCSLTVPTHKKVLVIGETMI